MWKSAWRPAARHHRPGHEARRDRAAARLLHTARRRADDLLRPTTFHTNCPFKGEASYWSLDVDGEIHDGIVWSYETPTAQAAGVRGMLSFYPDRTEVTVDSQSLRD